MTLVSLICKKFRLTSSKPTFSNLSAFLDERFSDVTVTVGHPDQETCSYKLHRNVLAGCSSVLYQSFTKSDTCEIPRATLHVTTFMSPAEFELLIIYLYTGELYFESVSELCAGLYAASLFQLSDLLKECTLRLQKKLQEDCGNALLILQLDKRFNCRDENQALFDQIKYIIEKDYPKILSSKVIEGLEKDTMKHLLQMNTTCCVREIEVFHALLRWTNVQCNKSGIERVAENLQKVAGDLIHHIRYNLIPNEILGTEVVKSGLLSESFFKLVIEKCNDYKINVPFCTQSREKIENQDALVQKEVEFESTCTLEEHLVRQVSQLSTIDTLLWNGEGGCGYLPLSAATTSNTRWKVKFWRDLNGNFGVLVRCDSLDTHFRAASVRLFAVVEGHPQVWTDAAAVLRSGEESSWGGWFSKKMSELPKIRPLKVCVRAQWTELDHLSSISNFWNVDAASIRYRWKLNDWRCVTPTSFEWRLFSESFGQSGALWRIIVVSERGRNDRELVVVVKLQHLPESINWSGLSWNCSLSLWGRQFIEKNMDMKPRWCCVWTIIDDVKSELRNPLDLNVSIHLTKRN